MNLSGKTIGFALTGSFCTFARVFPQAEALARAGARVIPVLSFNAWALDTRFFKAEQVRARLREDLRERSRCTRSKPSSRSGRRRRSICL